MGKKERACTKGIKDMNAKIFFLKESQTKDCDFIATMIRKHVYWDIDIDRLDIGMDENSDFRRSEDYKRLKSYSYLLKRCIVNSMAMDKANEFMKQDFNIILKLDNTSLWYYIETSGYSYVNDESWLEIYYRELNSIFPAVAIMDQMVILPYKIEDAFARHSDEGIFSWCTRPLDLGGVLLVDFEDRESIENAIQQVSLRIKSRIGKLSARHMMVRGIKEPDFEELSKLLNVDQQFLYLNKDEITCKKAKITVVVRSKPVKVDKTSRITIEIGNESEIPLGHVRVKVKAPQGALSGLVAKTLDFSISEPEPKSIDFDLHPAVVPYCPLSVLFELYDKDEELTPFPVFTTVDVVP